MCTELICKILFSFGLLKPICQLWGITSANVRNGIISTLRGQVAVIVDHLHLRFTPDVLLGRKSRIILGRYDAHKGAPNWANVNCGQSWIFYVRRVIGISFILIQTKNKISSLGTPAHIGKKSHVIPLYAPRESQKYPIIFMNTAKGIPETITCFE